MIVSQGEIMAHQINQQRQLDHLPAEYRLAEAVRQACLQAAQAGYEQAGWDGLCQAGSWECALEAIRAVDVEAIIRKFLAVEQ
jgi:hypothetical protein